MRAAAAAADEKMDVDMTAAAAADAAEEAAAEETRNALYDVTPLRVLLQTWRRASASWETRAALY